MLISIIIFREEGGDTIPQMLSTGIVFLYFQSTVGQI